MTEEAKEIHAEISKLRLKGCIKQGKYLVEELIRVAGTKEITIDGNVGTFTGEMLDGEAHGNGCWKSDNESYSGNWYQSKRRGFGKFNYPFLISCTGVWKDARNLYHQGEWDGEAFKELGQSRFRNF